MLGNLDGEHGSRYLVQIQQQYHVLEFSPEQVSHAALADLPALVEHLGAGLPRFSPLHLDRHALEGSELALILPLGQADCIQVFYRLAGDFAELSVLDERNALWRQQLPFRDEQSLLNPLQRFLQSVLYRRNASLPLDDLPPLPLDIRYYEVLPPPPQRALRLERRAAPQTSGNQPFYNVQAIVEPLDRQREYVTLYCNHREFSELEYGAELFAAVARHILEQRRENERYRCYLTDLDLSRVASEGQLQTIDYLRYKAKLEDALNAALLSTP